MGGALINLVGMDGCETNLACNLGVARSKPFSPFTVHSQSHTRTFTCALVFSMSSNNTNCINAHLLRNTVPSKTTNYSFSSWNTTRFPEVLPQHLDMLRIMTIDRSVSKSYAGLNRNLWDEQKLTAKPQNMPFQCQHLGFPDQSRQLIASLPYRVCTICIFYIFSAQDTMCRRMRALKKQLCQIIRYVVQVSVEKGR